MIWENDFLDSVFKVDVISTCKQRTLVRIEAVRLPGELRNEPDSIEHKVLVSIGGAIIYSGITRYDNSIRSIFNNFIEDAHIDGNKEDLINQVEWLISFNILGNSISINTILVDITNTH